MPIFSLKILFRYAGPDGGFRIRLSDNADADLSETEEIDDTASSAGSEITTASSSTVTQPQSNKAIDTLIVPTSAEAVTPASTSLTGAHPHVVDDSVVKRRDSLTRSGYR